MQFLLQQFRKAKPQGVSSKSDLPLERQTYIFCDKTVLCFQQGTSDSYEIPPAAVFAAQRRIVPTQEKQLACFSCRRYTVIYAPYAMRRLRLQKLRRARR